MSKKRLTLADNPLFSGPGIKDRERIGIPYRELQIDLIDTDPNQPRKVFDEHGLNELASSISTYGVLTPILVRPGTAPGRFDLIAGERRLRASKLAGRPTIPAIVDQGGAQSEERTLAIQLVENIQRTDLSPLERAYAIGALRDAFSLSVRDIADRLGVSKSMVHRSLELLELPDDLLNALKEGASESKVLLLAKIEDPEIRAGYLKDLEVLSRAKLEDKISQDGAKESTPKAELSSEDTRIVDEMQRSLGMKVRMLKVAPEQERGRLVIEFYSNQDLQELFRKLVAE
ncbi:MAG: ParB/RepB/Spo0J family partition protein [Proteobacteria bacterium]|nr:ParB/RepB/Spo0J family partition protein [Pseudomonadota bacterium]